MSAEIPPVPPGAKPVPNPCPRCGTPALHIEERLTVKRPGTYSLAGVQTKVAATQSVYLVCRACGAEVEGTVEADGAHANFNPDAMRQPDGH
jgi:hypothetical protein